MSQLGIGEQELTDSLQRLTKKGFIRIKLKDSNVFYSYTIGDCYGKINQRKTKRSQ